MLIVCPNCASEYSIESDHVGNAGRKVRCANCRETWFAFAQPIELMPEPETIVIAEAMLTVEAENSRSLPDEPALPKQWGRPKARFPKPAFAAQIAARARALPRAPLLAGVILALAGTAVAARGPIVRVAPQTAMLYAAIGLPVNLRGLTFQNVKATLEGSGREAVLVVTGEIENPTKATQNVPPLAVALRGPEGPPLYTWTNEAPRGTLAPAERAPFRARLASPPAEARQVLVGFATVSDGPTVAAPEH